MHEKASALLPCPVEGEPRPLCLVFFNVFFSILGAFLLLLLIPSSPRAGLDSIAEFRAEAVHLGRQGNLSEALEILTRLRRRAPADRALLYDTIAVLGWAEQDRQVVELLAEVPRDSAPLFVVSAAAKSLRNLADWNGAERWYRQGIERFPQDMDLKVGLILTLSDADRHGEALYRVFALVRRHPESPEVWEAKRYVAEQAGRRIEALHVTQQILTENPRNRQARRQQILLLENLGASRRALELAKKHPDTLSSDEIRRIRGSADALAVRWGDLPPAAPAERFVDTDRALAGLDETLAGLRSNVAPKNEFLLRSRFDRMVALRDRVQMVEVLSEYRDLQSAGIKFPDYVLHAVADASLYERQPAQARKLYEEILERDAVNHEARLGLFFALVETERHREALALVEEMVAAEPVWLHPGGAVQRSPNWRRLETETFAALGHFYADDLAEAERRFTALASAAPDNPDLLREQATVYLARGWPRRALEVLERGLARHPEHRGLRMGLAETCLTLRYFARAGQTITDLAAEFPEDRQVQRLDTLWRVHQMRELRIDTGLANSSGPTEGDRKWDLAARLYSAPFAENYRLFTGFSHDWGKFPEGSGTWQRYSAGLEYAGPDLFASLETTLNDGRSRQPGLSLSGFWELDDHWSVPFSGELFSGDTPQRAVRNGIRANAASLGIRYRFHESRSLQLNGQVMDFSDGNLRSRLALSGEQRLLTWPRHKLTGFGNLATSHNNRSSAPYFNPDADLTLLGGVEHLWRLYRRYDRSFHQRLRLSGGRYLQKGYAGGTLLGLEYAHIWEAAYRFNLSYGVSRYRRVYDGDPEWTNAAFLSLNWRF